MGSPAFANMYFVFKESKSWKNDGRRARGVALADHNRMDVPDRALRSLDSAQPGNQCVYELAEVTGCFSQRWGVESGLRHQSVP